MVDKHEYDACNINTTAPSFSTDNRLLSCNSPLELKYYQMAFRAYQAPGGREFSPGTRYYFIGNALVVSHAKAKKYGQHFRSTFRETFLYCKLKSVLPVLPSRAKHATQQISVLQVEKIC